MPLPCIKSKQARQCHARTKATGNQCLNPAAYGMRVCRFHGARKKESVLVAETHPNYRHGACTLEVRKEHKKIMLELKDIVKLMKRLRMLD